MFHINVDNQNNFSKNSEVFEVFEGETYEISARYKGEFGESFSAYLGIIFLDKEEKEKERRIRWLNDFSGEEKNTQIVFKSLSKKIILIYRINIETPITSKSSFWLEPIENLTLKQTQTLEDFDDPEKIVFPRKKELEQIEEEILEKNLVWIFGSPRSGSSWLALQLLSHGTHSINELHLTEHLGSPHVGFLDLTYMRWFDSCKNLKGYFFSDMYKSTWMYYLKKLILNRINAQIGNIDRKIILKEPSAASGSDIISDCFTKSHIIFLLRDGRDIIDSIVDASQEGGFMNLARGIAPITKHNRTDFIEYRARLWVNLVDNLLKTYEIHPDKLKIIIKYEDLLKTTKEILKQIYDFLEIKINDKELDEIITKFNFKNIPIENRGTKKFARSASPGQWKNNFNEKEKEIMEKIMRPTLDKLGYT